MNPEFTTQEIEKRLDLSATELRTKLSDKIESKVNSEHKDQVMKAISLAIYLHIDQKDRPDGPYVNHVLRVAERILNDFGVIDPDVLSAAPLHDSVEDQLEKLTALAGLTSGSHKQQALDYLKVQFGENVVRIIEAVTNPESSRELEVVDRNREYSMHIEEAIEDLKVMYVKLSDFMDNGLNVINIDNIKWQLKLAKKYLPIYSIFIIRLNRPDVIFPEGKKEDIIAKLSSAQRFAEKLIAENS